MYGTRKRFFRTLGVPLVIAANTPRGEEGGKYAGTSNVQSLPTLVYTTQLMMLTVWMQEQPMPPEHGQ